MAKDKKQRLNKFNAVFISDISGSACMQGNRVKNAFKGIVDGITSSDVVDEVSVSFYAFGNECEAKFNDVVATKDFDDSGLAGQIEKLYKEATKDSDKQRSDFLNVLNILDDEILSEDEDSEKYLVLTILSDGKFTDDDFSLKKKLQPKLPDHVHVIPLFVPLGEDKNKNHLETLFVAISTIETMDDHILDDEFEAKTTNLVNHCWKQVKQLESVEENE